MNAYPYASDAAIAAAQAALGNCPIATEDSLKLSQLVVLAANLMP